MKPSLKAERFANTFRIAVTADTFEEADRENGDKSRMRNKDKKNESKRSANTGTNNGNVMSYTLIIVVACYFIYIAFTIFVGLYRGDREVHWYHILIAVLLTIAGVGALIYTYKKYRAGEITNHYPTKEEEEESSIEESSDEKPSVEESSAELFPGDEHIEDHPVEEDSAAETAEEADSGEADDQVSEGEEKKINV